MISSHCTAGNNDDIITMHCSIFCIFLISAKHLVVYFEDMGFAQMSENNLYYPYLDYLIIIVSNQKSEIS